MCQKPDREGGLAVDQALPDDRASGATLEIINRHGLDRISQLKFENA